jgi:glycosyltransferase involved in cell wall biosynthesis
MVDRVVDSGIGAGIDPGLDAGRLLQVVTSTDRRGAEVFATQLGGALDQRGWAVDTIALWPGAAPGLDLEALAVCRRDPRAIRALRRRLDEVRMVVGHGSSTLPFATAAVAGTDTPFVYRSIGDPAFWGSNRARRARVGVALRRADAVVALWPGAAETIADRYRVKPERIHVIPTGVPADRFTPTAPDARAAARAALGLGLDPDRATVLLLGALTPEKNPLAAVEAMAALPDAQLLVGGVGSLADDVAQQGRRLASGRIHLAGSVSDPATLFAAADVLVLPSRSEGIPAVAIEAALAALPVVASRVGGVPEVVAHGETGVLVDAPTPFRLAQAIVTALAEAAAMGSAARTRALDRFTLDVVADQWDAVLGRVGAR